MFTGSRGPGAYGAGGAGEQRVRRATRQRYLVAVGSAEGPVQLLGLSGPDDLSEDGRSDGVPQVDIAQPSDVPESGQRAGQLRQRDLGAVQGEAVYRHLAA